MDVIINNPPAAQTYQTQGLPYGYGPQMYGHHHDGPPIGFLALLIGGFLLLRRRRFAGRAFRPGPDADLSADMREKFRQGRQRFFNDGALDIARERYARGEINADEYETLKRHLSGEGQKSESYRRVDEPGDLKL